MRHKSIQIASSIILSLVFQINLKANETKNCHNFANNGPCEEVYSGGTIGTDQTVCLEANFPDPIVSLSEANNGEGAFEYMWIKTTENPTNPLVVWTSVPGAASASYSPPPLYQTTWFRRCSRPVGCVAFGSESNEVKIMVEACVDPCETFNINLVAKTSPTCHEGADGKIELSIEGGQAPFAINWNGIDATGLLVENLAKGNYSVEITDVNGCFTSKIIELTAPDALKVNSIKGDATCFSTKNGWITVSVDGGTPPYTYINNGIETTENELKNLASGIYDILVIDANGCQNATAVQIFEPTKIELSATTTSESCMQNDASIEVNATGGLPPYSFQWDNGETTQDLENIAAGNYFLSVHDRNDCTAHLAIAVDNDCAPVTIDFEETMLNKMGNNTIKIDWVAHNETPNGVFLVERSIDGENFEIIGEPVSGDLFSANGNRYYLMDDAPKDGLNYYQIRHYDKEGKICLSKINALFFTNEHTPEISIYPNPVANEIHFDFLQPIEETTTIQLLDTFGKLIFSEIVEKGTRFSSIDISNLSAGSYFTQILDGKTSLTKKIVKE